MNDRHHDASSAPAAPPIDDTQLWRRLRELAEEQLARIEPSTPAARVEAPAIYMTYAEYADHRHVSASTVKRWRKRGMPAEQRGATVRIAVAKADAWKDPTDGDPEADEREGATAAARGKVRR